MTEEKSSRHHVGTSTAGERIKHAHRKSGKHRGPLKVFARKLLIEGDKDATDWFAAKAGSLNLSRMKEKIKRITEEKLATKNAKSKKK